MIISVTIVMASDNERDLYEGSGYYDMEYIMLYCVANVYDCGATIPLYQYYSSDLQGISSFFSPQIGLLPAVLRQLWLYLSMISIIRFCRKNTDALTIATLWNIIKQTVKITKDSSF